MLNSRIKIREMEERVKKGIKEGREEGKKMKQGVLVELPAQ